MSTAAKSETSADSRIEATCDFDGFPMPWVARVNGKSLRGKTGRERVFKTEASARRAAQKAAPSPKE